MNKVPCSGCSLLCDDVIVKTDGIYIDEIVGACIKGKERFEQVTSQNRLLSPLVRKGQELQPVSWDEAINAAVEIIKKSSKPILYGFSNSSCEAQMKGIELASAINGFIDSNATACQGRVLNRAKETGIAFTSLSEIINKADVLVFWGANPAESEPRLLNKVLFSRGKFRLTGREIKTIIIIDPVKTATFGVMGIRDLALLIKPNEDLSLIRALKEECCQEDSIPSSGVAGIEKSDLKRLLVNITNAEYAVIFVGQGLLNSRANENTIKELLELVEMINLKQHKGRIGLVLLDGHYNMAGFAQVALAITGKNDSLEFSKEELVNSNETLISKIERDDFDTSIIVGTDPISHLPRALSSKLASKPLILIDNFKSTTYHAAEVVLPTAITGIECDGLAYRLDNVPIDLKRVVNPPNNVPSDYELLTRILNKIKGP